MTDMIDTAREPNKENINKLIELLESIPEGNEKTTTKSDLRYLRMSSWYQPSICGTVGCIGGWATHLMAEEDRKILAALAYRSTVHLSERAYMAAGWLGLNHPSACKMLYMEGSPLSMGEFDVCYTNKTRVAIVIKLLEHFRDTGAVDWDKAMEDSKR